MESKWALGASVLAVFLFVVYWQVFSHSYSFHEVYVHSQLSYAAVSVTLTVLCGALLGFLADCVTRALGWKIKRVEEADVEFH